MCERLSDTYRKYEGRDFEECFENWDPYLVLHLSRLHLNWLFTSDAGQVKPNKNAVHILYDL